MQNLAMPLTEQPHLERINEHGNTVKYYTTPGIGNRYHFDFNLYAPGTGWKQYDTDRDAWYFGIWVNLEERKIATYAEGDLSIVIAPDDRHLKAELDTMEAFYGPAPAAFKIIDKNNNLLRIYDKRPSPPDPEV